jgi:CO/xanthine dehydrogenase FAD-binding subunit
MSVAIIMFMEKRSSLIKDVRISAGSVTPTPQRMVEAEAFLKGKKPDKERLKITSRKVSEAMIQRAGVRPSTPYKAPVVEALFLRGMKKALGKEI